MIFILSFAMLNLYLLYFKDDFWTIDWKIAAGEKNEMKIYFRLLYPLF